MCAVVTEVGRQLTVECLELLVVAKSCYSSWPACKYGDRNKSYYYLKHARISMVDTDNSFVFVVYITVLLVAQSVYAKIVGRGNNELERMRKILYWHLRGRFKENDEKTLSREQTSWF